jgi:hypothetical protein
MGVEAVIATQVIDTTTVGRSVMTAVDAAAARTALGLGTLATQSGTFSGTSSGTNTGDQDLSGYLTSASAAAAYQVILVSGTNIKTVNGSTLLGSGDLTISGLSGTGSVDNAALRADGTGGATLQNSAWIINDNLTASPNNTVNHACLEATGVTTNVSVSIKPKGTGAFSLAVPDGTATGGNARGANAVDFQTLRNSASQVASGTGDFQAGGRNTTSGSYCATFGQDNSNSGQHSFVCGSNNTNTQAYGGVFGGFFNSASQIGAVVLGGIQASAYRRCMRAFAANGFATTGDCQGAELVLQCVTTTNAAVEMQISGNARLTIPTGKIGHYLLIITGVRAGGADVAYYTRRVVIKNIGGTTSLVGSVDTIGSDVATGTSLSVSADNTNDSLNISPTGVASETWRWNCIVYGGEINHS